MSLSVAQWLERPTGIWHGRSWVRILSGTQICFSLSHARDKLNEHFVFIIHRAEILPSFITILKYILFVPRQLHEKNNVQSTKHYSKTLQTNLLPISAQVSRNHLHQLNLLSLSTWL